MDGMTIDSINGSQTIQNSGYFTKLQTTTERSTMTPEDKKQIDQAVTKRKETEGMISKDLLDETVDKLNDFLEAGRRNLKFEMHDKLEKYYVTVVDSTTSEVIKEIPPKKLLDMYAAMAEFMGILVDKKI
ncbi:flagellar protein FlaG [Ralstonia pickettii]|nr:flagellar protein FlaG [Ralstonia pickettii]